MRLTSARSMLKSIPENLCVQTLEGINACTETNDTSEKSPNTPL